MIDQSKLNPDATMNDADCFRIGMSFFMTLAVSEHFVMALSDDFEVRRLDRCCFSPHSALFAPVVADSMFVGWGERL